MLESDLRQFIVNNFLFGQDDPRLNSQSSLLESRIIDSTGVLELIMFLEEKYAIKLRDEEIIPDNLDSISNLARLITRKISRVPAHP